MISFPLNIFFKALSPNITRSDVRLQCRDLGGYNWAHNRNQQFKKYCAKKIKMLSLLESKRMLIKGKIWSYFLLVQISSDQSKHFNAVSILRLADIQFNEATECSTGQRKLASYFGKQICNTHQEYKKYYFSI